MRDRLRSIAVAVVAILVTCAAVHSQTPAYPGIGRTPSETEIEQWDIAVGPSGKELPPGSGSAKDGAPIYMKCMVCHGPSLEGTAYGPRLAGGRGTLTTPTPIRTVGSFWPYATTLWDYINRAMPRAPFKEGSLRADEVYALTAFVLYKNGIVAEDAVMDAKSLPQVRMPNRDGFFPARPDWRWYEQFCHLGNCRAPSGGSRAAPATPTRVIALSGNLAFGNVNAGSSASSTLIIHNTGNSTLTVSRIIGSHGITGVLATPNWASGTVAPGESLAIAISFSPIAVERYNGMLTVYGDQTDGISTIAMSGTGRFPLGGLRRFGAGQHRVGTEIAAGRYYAAPAKGCYWERKSGPGGSPTEVIANGFVDFKAGQWIVDILPSDKLFKTDVQCGTWLGTPRQGSQGISPGMWLVGSQIIAGTYRTTAQSGCHWERLRDFGGTRGSVIARAFTTSAGPQLVSIAAGDAGFATNDGCGIWTQVAPAAADRSPHSSRER